MEQNREADRAARETTPERIMTNRLDRGFFQYQQELEEKALEVLRSGWYVLGKEVAAFEEEFAAYVGAEHCVGVGNGLDALHLAFRALGIGSGDEVLVQGNTYIASVMGITMNGATPVFVEPTDAYVIDDNALEEKITARTKAILVVHLYGQATPMEKILELCRAYRLKLVEDCAQSHGAAFQGRQTGTFGDIGCFSFYPSKNLGAFGDGGAIVTSDAELARKIRVYRNYGSEKRYYNQVVGVNSRLDELQAGLLRVRLRHLDELNGERRKLAETYLHGLEGCGVGLPLRLAGCTHVWHQFVIRSERRDALADALRQQGIDTLIHYPIPPHLSEAYRYLGFHRGDLPKTERLAGSVLSLPLYTGMTEEEQRRVIAAVRAFGEARG